MPDITSINGILNIIRQSASMEYQARVPEAVQQNIADVGNPILENSMLANEFIHSLVGRIGATMVRTRIATNKLAILKKGTMPLGIDIQDIFVNMAEDKGYDPTGASLLSREIPDVKVLYHRRNRQSQYKATISREQLASAFISYDKMNELISGVVNAMYSGDNRDEFVLTKNTFASAIQDNKIVNVAVPHISTAGSPKQITKDIINAVKLMQFPSQAWNAYNLNRPESDEGRPVETWTPLENQILIIRADIMTEIEVEELAVAFNLDKVSFMSRVVEVDNFGSAVNCYAILADESWVQVHDNLYETGDFYNPAGLYWNYFLNHWQTYSLATFANAVAFICNTETISVSPTSLTFTTSSTQTLTPTVTPGGSTVTWLSTDSDIATVSSAGVVTPHENGTCFITAINGDAIVNIPVTVNIP